MPKTPPQPKKDSLPWAVVTALITGGIALLVTLPKTESTQRALIIVGMTLVGVGIAYIADHFLTGTFDLDTIPLLGARAAGGVGIVVLFVYLGWKISEPQPGPGPGPGPSVSVPGPSIPSPPLPPPSLVHGYVHLQGEGELKLSLVSLRSGDGTCVAKLEEDGAFAFACPPNSLSVRYNGLNCGLLKVGDQGLLSNVDNDITLSIGNNECRLKTFTGYGGEVRIDDVGKADLVVRLSGCGEVHTDHLGAFGFPPECSPSPDAQVQVLDGGHSLGEFPITRNELKVIKIKSHATSTETGGAGAAAVPVASAAAAARPTLPKCDAGQQDELARIIRTNLNKDAKIISSFKSGTVTFRTAPNVPPSTVTIARGPHCQL